VLIRSSLEAILKHNSQIEQRSVICRLEDFDTQSGSLVERTLFNNRPWIIVLSLIVTLLLGWQATRLKLNASYEKTIPTTHPYIAN